MGPLALFYGALLLAGFRGALVAALAWSYLALYGGSGGESGSPRCSLLGAALLTGRLRSPSLRAAPSYFAQPMATAVAAALVLIASGRLGRPLTQRFVHDFCPIDPELLARPRVRQFFVRISLLWATVLIVNAGITLRLLLSFSAPHVSPRTDGGHLGTDGAGHLPSITWFVASMRKDGITVEWGR